MIALTALMKVKPEHAKDFEELAKTLVEKTKEEPGNHLYRLHKSNDGKTYLFYEVYADEAAIQAHMKSSHFQEAMPSFMKYLEGPPQLSRFEIVAG